MRRRPMKSIARAILALAVVSLATPAIAAPVRGTIIDAKTGAPLVGVSIYLIETGEVAVTDEHGAFEFADVAAGEWHVAAIDPAYERKDTTVTVVAGRDGPVPLSISLS